jgi:myo-inositol 2-dehydrogenase/D-chiro-inositol 1-dehydrogenase
MYDPSGFFIAYSKASGAIFLDCGIHDIDMSRWLLDVANPANLTNPMKQVTSVYASGMNVHHPELADSGDCDHAFAMVQYENGSKCTFHLSRTNQNGHDAVCEVYGSEAKLTVNWVCGGSTVAICFWHSSHMYLPLMVRDQSRIVMRSGTNGESGLNLRE